MTVPIRGFDHVGLTVPDLDEAIGLEVAQTRPLDPIRPTPSSERPVEPFTRNLDGTSPLRGNKPVGFGRLSSIKRPCSV